MGSTKNILEFNIYCIVTYIIKFYVDSVYVFILYGANSCESTYRIVCDKRVVTTKQ